MSEIVPKDIVQILEAAEHPNLRQLGTLQSYIERVRSDGLRKAITSKIELGKAYIEFMGLSRDWQLVIDSLRPEEIERAKEAQRLKVRAEIAELKWKEKERESQLAVMEAKYETEALRHKVEHSELEERYLASQGRLGAQRANTPEKRAAQRSILESELGDVNAKFDDLNSEFEDLKSDTSADAEEINRVRSALRVAHKLKHDLEKKIQGLTG